MIRTSFGIACLIYIAFIVWLFRECLFLAPHRSFLWQEYGRTFLFFSVVFLANLTSAVHGVVRWITLKDTGKRLAHMERQLRHGPTISEELTDRIRELGGK